jgi:uncharacterized protein YgiM (DUF1202 family)
MSARSFSFSFAIRFALALAAIALWTAPHSGAFAQTPMEGGGEAPPPAPSIEAAPPAPAPLPMPPAPAAKSTSFRHSVVVEDAGIEPASAHVLLKEDTWVYSKPAKSGRKVEKVHAGKYINVTGSTHYYLRVELKTGKTGYISQSAAVLVRPVDKTFNLTSDSSVLDRPNRWGSKIAEVHRGHDVHVIGVALEYMQIRMKDGREGYIPAAALE